MDSISDPDTDEIVVMSSAQVGKSELINNIIGYYIDYDPSPDAFNAANIRNWRRHIRKTVLHL